MQHHGRLLIDTFYGYKVHIGARNSLADSLRISRIILLPLNVGLHISRGNEPHVMAKCSDLTGPMVGRRAGFHADQARWQFSQRT